MGDRDKARRRDLVEVQRADGTSNAAPEAAGLKQVFDKLQRSVGNRAVFHLLSKAQPKLEVGASDDPYEREADAIASTVVARLQGGAAGTHDAGTHDAGTHDAGTHDAGTAPVRRLSEVGAGGGELSRETEADIQRARSGGVPMDTSTRDAMEQAFGTDFGSVRLHSGQEAASLNERVQAKAFTVGNDVFFRDALPDAKTKQGQELLAHELAHTVQQGGNVGRRIQRLAFRGTAWSQASQARVSTGGGVGVLIIRDNQGPLIVKAGEAMAPEVSVAAELLNQAVGGGSTGWQGSAPEARPVELSEAKQIHAKAVTLLGNSAREQNILDDLEKGFGVMVFGFAGGTEMGDLLKQSQTKKGSFGGRSVRKDSISYALMNEPGLMQTLGRGAAADLSLGNVDRLIGSVNLENMLVDLANKRVSFIDNVQLKMETFLHDTATFGGIKGRDSFMNWTQHDMVKKLGAHDFGSLAAFTMEELANKVYGDTKRGKTNLGEVPEEDRLTVKKAFEKAAPQMQQWLVQGLSDGLANALGAMQNVRSLIGGVSDDAKKSVATNVLARRNFLQGQDANAAWAAAETEANRMFSWQKAEPTKKLTGSQPGGNGNGNGNGNTGGGSTGGGQPQTTTSTSTWQRATPSQTGS